MNQQIRELMGDMLEFNLKACREGVPVYTRGGETFTFAGYHENRGDTDNGVVVGWVGDQLMPFYTDGTCALINCTRYDLTTKKDPEEYWVNVYKLKGETFFGTLKTCPSDALMSVDWAKCYVKTVKLVVVSEHVAKRSPDF